MPSNVRIELNSAGIQALLKSAGAQADLARRAAAIAGAAGASGGTFGHDVQVGRTRARAIVWTEDVDAMRAEATTRALTRAIDAGRS